MSFQVRRNILKEGSVFFVRCEVATALTNELGKLVSNLTT